MPVDEGAEPQGFLLSVADLQAAEAELRVEAEMKGQTMPEHTTKQEADTPCPYCTAVARRAIRMVKDTDGPQN